MRAYSRLQQISKTLVSSKMPNTLVVGATRGLGLELAKLYASNQHTVVGTGRSSAPKDQQGIKWITGVDVADESAGKAIVDGLEGQRQDLVIIAAGYMDKESLDEPKFDSEVKMYKICSIGPVFICSALHKAGLLSKGTKIVLISSEGGSITLRTQGEGGGMYGHHGSKAALNMAGRLLSFDLKDAGIIVSMVHPGFMRTEMTKGVGFDQFWDEGGAVTPDVAAKQLSQFIEKLDMSQTGQFWAPRGPGDIGTVEATMGPKDKLPTPLQLPW